MPGQEPTMTRRLDAAYERELLAIRTHVAKMAALAEEMVQDAVRVLIDRDPDLARKVRDADADLDRIELECDQLCATILARRSPVAGDLRMVTGTLKLVTDLERIGDLAVNICKRSLQIGPGASSVPKEVAELAECVTAELALALEALVRQDSTLARRLRAEDRSTDERNRTAFERLLGLSNERPDSFEDLLALTNVCRNLERIGDHAVNISERVVYMVDGTVVRHSPE